MKLIALVLLLSAFTSLTLMEVVQDFESKCSEFFIRRPNTKTIITPTVFKGYQYKKICQRWNNIYRYATLYDIKERIPVYSAYKFTGEEHSGRNEEWKNEPQLESGINSPDMRRISVAEMDEFFNQAVNRDYEESEDNTEPKMKYTRGHVFPNQYAADRDQADSTFTFTNVAPQTEHSNGEWADEVENPMKKKIEKECKNETSNADNIIPTYIVTGVVPGNNHIHIKRPGKKTPTGVNIPSYYWTAFCCVQNNDVIISKAYLALQNEQNDKTYEISEMSVDRLNARLTRLYNQDFSVFGSLCLT